MSALIARAHVSLTELAWLGGFLQTAIPERPDLHDRADRAYAVMRDLMTALEAKLGETP